MEPAEATEARNTLQINQKNNRPTGEAAVMGWLAEAVFRPTGYKSNETASSAA